MKLHGNLGLDWECSCWWYEARVWLACRLAHALGVWEILDAEWVRWVFIDARVLRAERRARARGAAGER